ncbi:response regulator [Micavibrio aeruginosavorus]|uniref:Two-component response regulator n=1 Tax=Micavibrio aeruginosavorus EPB TaxID=349215 RepID=M4VI78_9BACT|nr:response regulator [Micavibrio aeruginosavorus]AGH98903.1 two-component response regulator [Micavibrio aeruginosavorus EPB]
MTNQHNPDDIEMVKRPSYEETYQKLLYEYIRRLEKSVEAIDNILAQRQLSPLTKDDLLRAQMLAHGMSGSGATFGFSAVSDAGRKADVFLDRLIRSMPDDGTMDDESYPEFEMLMKVLQGTCRNAVNKGGDGPTIPKDQSAARDGHVKEVLNVLIVDDDESLSQMLALKLVQRGIHVINARDGKAALSQCQKGVPDLIILDIMMPGLSGHEVLRRLKQDPAYVDVPVVMLTGRAQQQDVVGALHSGAIDYVVKPFDPDHLVSRVEKILDASRYTVLIADNDPLILQLLESKFRNRGFKVVLAGDGKDAFDIIRTNAPDLIILDVMMPEVDGISLLKRVRSNTATADIPVIMLSGHKDQRDIDRGMEAGAQDYVAKPFMPDDLIARTLRVLKTGVAGTESGQG